MQLAGDCTLKKVLTLGFKFENLSPRDFILESHIEGPGFFLQMWT